MSVHANLPMASLRADVIFSRHSYHSKQTVRDLQTLDSRTYISEPDRGPQSWVEQEAERDAVYALGVGVSKRLEFSTWKAVG